MATWQDDLAEHTMHSPVWVDYNATIEVGEDISDWEYYSDDYYDHVQGLRGTSSKETTGTKRKSSGRPHNRTKRRRLDPPEAIPKLSLGEPMNEDSSEPRRSSTVVCWKTPKTFKSLEYPILADDQGEAVALLKDWRERFKIILKQGQIAEDEEYDTPVARGDVIMPECGKQSDGSREAHDSTPRAKSRKNRAESSEAVNTGSAEYAVPVMKGGVVVVEKGMHSDAPNKATQTTVNGIAPSMKNAQLEEKEPLGTQTSRVVVMKSPQSSRKRKAEDAAEAKNEDVAVCNPQAAKPNIQQDVSTSTRSLKGLQSVGRKKQGQDTVGKAPSSGKENGNTTEAITARRSKRVKQSSSS